MNSILIQIWPLVQQNIVNPPPDHNHKSEYCGTTICIALTINTQAVVWKISAYKVSPFLTIQNQPKTHNTKYSAHAILAPPLMINSFPGMLVSKLKPFLTWRGLRKCLDSSSAFQLEITFNTCVSTYCSRSWAISLSRTIFTKLALPRRYTVNLKLKIVAQAGKSTSTFSISGSVQSGQTPAAISVAQDLIYWRVHRVWCQYYHIRLLKRCQGYNCTMYYFFAIQPLFVNINLL